MGVRRDVVRPGECVSADQCMSSYPGRLPHTHGKEKGSLQYTGGTVFCDHYSSYVFLANQVSLGTGETLQSKHAFQQHAYNLGVSEIKSFRSDNNPFTSEEWMEDLELNQQTISYSGVGAHHQNGVAERTLQTIIQWA